MPLEDLHQFMCIPTKISRFFLWTIRGTVRRVERSVGPISRAGQVVLNLSEKIEIGHFVVQEK